MKEEDKITVAKYTLKIGKYPLKDGHVMFPEDIVSDLNRKSHLEERRYELIEFYKNIDSYSHKEIQVRIKNILY